MKLSGKKSGPKPKIVHDAVWWYDKIGLSTAVVGLCCAIVAYGDKIGILFIPAILIAAAGSLMVIDTFVHEKGLVKG